MLRENIERRRVAWEHELVAGMRRDEPEAFMEYFRTFRPLLIAEARRLRVQPALCREIADECLDDVAMRLRRYTTPVPRSLAPYLVRALRLHRLELLRGDRRRRVEELEGGAFRTIQQVRSARRFPRRRVATARAQRTSARQRRLRSSD